jgi:hypothetical protein
MTSQTKGPNPDGPALLTPDEFIKLAGDRGKKLWIETSGNGDPMITDGAKRHLLPRLPRGLMPSRLVRSLVDLFFDSDRLAVDFALDPREDD